MEALLFTLFISVALIALAFVFFGRLFQGGDLEGSDSVSLLPLDEDEVRSELPALSDPQVPNHPEESRPQEVTHR